MALTTIKIVHIFVLIVYSVAAIVFAIKSLKNINSSSEEAIDMTDNWREGAILDIAVAETCPTGYQVAFNTTYPGTVAGCFCGAISDFNATLYKVKKENVKKACSSTQISAGCVNILPSEKVLIDSWGKINNTKQKLCLNRSAENWATQGPISGAQCQDPSMKKCGSNPQNAYCTKEDRCPINYINIIKLNASIAAAEIAACVYRSGCIKISDNAGDVRILRFKRADAYDALPTSEIKINEFSMCTNTDKENTTPNRYQFWLLDARKKSCNQTGAILWNTLDSRTEYDLYSINGLGPTMDYLGPYGYFGNGTGNSYQWSLFQRSYVPWNVSCRGYMEEAVTKSHGARNLKTAQIVQVIVSAIVNSIMGLILPCFMLIDKYPVFTKVFNWVGKLTLLPVQLVCALMAASVYTFFTTTVEDFCSTPPIIMILRNFAVGVGATYQSNIKGIVSSVLAILFDIGNWLWQWYKRRSEQGKYAEFGVEVPLRNQQQQGGVSVNVKAGAR